MRKYAHFACCMVMTIHSCLAAAPSKDDWDPFSERPRAEASAPTSTEPDSSPDLLGIATSLPVPAPLPQLFYLNRSLSGHLASLSLAGPYAPTPEGNFSGYFYPILSVPRTAIGDTGFYWDRLSDTGERQLVQMQLLIGPITFGAFPVLATMVPGSMAISRIYCNLPSELSATGFLLEYSCLIFSGVGPSPLALAQIFKTPVSVTIPWSD